MNGMSPDPYSYPLIGKRRLFQTKWRHEVKEVCTRPTGLELIIMLEKKK